MVNQVQFHIEDEVASSPCEFLENDQAFLWCEGTRHAGPAEFRRMVLLFTSRPLDELVLYKERQRLLRNLVHFDVRSGSASQSFEENQDKYRCVENSVQRMNCSIS